MLDRQQMRQLKIEPPDQAVYKEVLGNWDALAKPLDGMGEFEELFARIGAIRRDPVQRLCKRWGEGRALSAGWQKQPASR